MRVAILSVFTTISNAIRMQNAMLLETRVMTRFAVFLIFLARMMLSVVVTQVFMVLLTHRLPFTLSIKCLMHVLLQNRRIYIIVESLLL